jgi:hypothetical protein
MQGRAATRRVATSLSPCRLVIKDTLGERAFILVCGFFLLFLYFRFCSVNYFFRGSCLETEVSKQLYCFLLAKCVRKVLTVACFEEKNHHEVLRPKNRRKTNGRISSPDGV